MRRNLIRIPGENSVKLAVIVPYKVHIYPGNGRISKSHSDVNELYPIMEEERSVV